MGDIEREAKEVPFDFTGNTKLLINLIEGCSSHSKQDDWKEKNPYPDRPAQWLLQEFRLKIRVRQGNRISSERDKYAKYFQNLVTKEKCVSERDGEANPSEDLVLGDDMGFYSCCVCNPVSLQRCGGSAQFFPRTQKRITGQRDLEKVRFIKIYFRRRRAILRKAAAL